MAQGQKRGRSSSDGAEEEPVRKVLAIESHRAPIIQHFDENGTEYHLQEPTPEQKFAEIVQRLDFSQSSEQLAEQTEVPKPPEKPGKNPLELFHHAAGELEQVVTLLKAMKETPPNVVQKYPKGSSQFPKESSQDKISRDKVLQLNYMDLKQRQNALKNASERLKAYASFARKRHSKLKERKNDVIELRKEWKLRKLPQEQKHGEIRHWFDIDYSFNTCGAADTASVLVVQTPNNTSITLPETLVNHVLEFYTQSDSISQEQSTSARFVPSSDTVDTTAKGVENITNLLNNAQFTLLYSDIFKQLSAEALASNNPNHIVRERDVILTSSASDVLRIRFISQKEDSLNEDNENQKEQFSASYFDMSLFHICLLKILYLKYCQQHYNHYWKTGIDNNGLLSQKNGEIAMKPVKILDSLERIYSHIMFRKNIDEMLSSLGKAFGKSGCLSNHPNSFPKFGKHRSLQVRWVTTDIPTISSVDVRLCEGCLIQITLYETTAIFEDQDMKFRNVDSLREFLLLRFCKYILSQLRSEIISQNHTTVLNAYSLVLPEIMKKSGFQMELIIQPDTTQPSLIREVVTISSTNSKKTQTIPLSEIPGCSYRSKVCFLLKNPYLNSFVVLQQNMIEP